MFFGLEHTTISLYLILITMKVVTTSVDSTMFSAPMLLQKFI